ncbi:MAG: FmdB family zinc ribbon protein [Eubacteriales bacterium]
MPIFEYQCQTCEKVFEILQLPGKNNGDLKCTACGSTNLKKLISAPFLPSSVGKPANDDLRCCGAPANKEGGAPDKGCTPGSCCGKAES